MSFIHSDAEIFPVETQHNKPLEAIEGAFLIERRRILPRETQMRRTFNAEELRELAASIQSLRSHGGGIAGTGILHPLNVHWEAGAIRADGTIKPDARVIIDQGESRWRASEVAGFGPDDLLPVIAGDHSPRVATLTMLIENIQRNNVPPMELAQALSSYANQHNLTFRGLAEGIGKPLWWVQNYLDLLRADPNVLRVLDDNPENVYFVQRASRIKNQALRDYVVELRLEGAGSPTLYPLIKWDALPPEMVARLMNIIEKYRKQAKANSQPLDWKKLHPILRRYLWENGYGSQKSSDWKPLPYSQDAGTGAINRPDVPLSQSDPENRPVPARPGKSVHTVAAHDIELALASVVRQLEHTAQAAWEATIIDKPGKCARHLSEIEALVTGLQKTVAARRQKRKPSPKTPNL